MKPTIYDVAKEAGVSTATVSKVINNTGKIGDKTKEKVLRVMEQLNYQPKTVASAPRGKLSHSIGLLIPDLANPFFAEFARSIEDCGRELGYSILICSTDFQKANELKHSAFLIDKKVDGIIIISGSQDESFIKELLDKQIPTVIVNKELTTPLPIDSVSVDDFIGGYEATKHLLELGHRRICTIQLGELLLGKERLRGYKHALEEFEVKYEKTLTFFSSPNATIEESKQISLEILSAPQRPTAIFAGNDILALGVIHAAMELGLSIPDDLSVIGFDNTVLSAMSNPPLTTMAQSIQDMGRLSINLLLEEIKGMQRNKQKIQLRPELVVRRSTRELVR
ncbi:LacI family transcriptional regulator [Brevibacillus sp. NSP2.1]|uniref:LacI family DNA-binding transcriptional regulator n=1 Tax=Brevibacillus sp. NSP2.1 TaxID=3003229 RepID=UPI0003F642BE|nr:LacI family DNA-binding transcriptional regulator [Brevibacillus sp. NSP2.1]QHZ54816.1 LacI family transcriptional regulator [Brevibacillus sp. NSP2.1]